jgi:hypothetical protein
MAAASRLSEQNDSPSSQTGMLPRRIMAETISASGAKATDTDFNTASSQRGRGILTLFSLL